VPLHAAQVANLIVSRLNLDAASCSASGRISLVFLMDSPVLLHRVRVVKIGSVPD